MEKYQEKMFKNNELDGKTILVTGGGTGLGFKYQLTEKITTDFTYNLFYTKVNMNENIQSFGLQHGLVLRIIWS